MLVPGGVGDCSGGCEECCVGWIIMYVCVFCFAFMSLCPDVPGRARHSVGFGVGVGGAVDDVDLGVDVGVDGGGRRDCDVGFGSDVDVVGVVFAPAVVVLFMLQLERSCVCVRKVCTYFPFQTCAMAKTASEVFNPFRAAVPFRGRIT